MVLKSKCRRVVVPPSRESKTDENVRSTSLHLTPLIFVCVPCFNGSPQPPRIAHHPDVVLEVLFADQDQDGSSLMRILDSTCSTSTTESSSSATGPVLTPRNDLSIHGGQPSTASSSHDTNSSGVHVETNSNTAQNNYISCNNS